MTKQDLGSRSNYGHADHRPVSPASTMSGLLPTGKALPSRPGRVVSGYLLGVLKLESGLPNIPGNVGNASTFPYPVLYKTIPSMTYLGVKEGSSSFVEMLTRAAVEAEREGVRAIIGECGFMLPYQERIASAVRIPVLLSSLSLLPLILLSLGSEDRIGIVTAELRAWEPRMWSSLPIPRERVVVAGVETLPAWQNYYWNPDGFASGLLDPAAAESEVVSVARQLVDSDPKISAILLECAAMPPYAEAVYRATGLPVLDFLTLARVLQDSIAKRRYEGYL